jgi:acetyl-CoA acetyltransferase family protein
MAHEALILGGARTPIGRYGGSLSGIRTDDLLGMAMNAACERSGVRPEQVHDIAVGCVNVAHEGMGDIARWAALAAGFPDDVPGYTVNRFCASSLTCTINIARAIEAGDISLGIAAGVESMSRSGWAFMKGDAPFSPRGPLFVLDTMWAGAGGPPNPALLASNAYIAMIETAQNVATKYELTGTEIDEFALRSHKRAADARASGRFAREIFPVKLPAKKGRSESVFEHDEGIREDATLEQLAALPPQPNTEQSDGASAVALASRGHAEQLGAIPIAKVLASATVAVDPTIMGIAPAYALPAAIQRAGLKPEDIDVYEIHEAFAAQVLGVLREFANQTSWEIPDNRLNPNGGAVALGHPFGDSGTRCVLTLALELREREARYGAVGICVGSGQGVALVIENER